MMAPQLRWRRCVQHALHTVLVWLCLCVSPGLHAALTVQVVGAPEPALRALRAAAPDIVWVPDAGDGAAAAVTLRWLAGTDDAASRQRADSRPQLVLARNASDWPLRAGDSALYWGVDLVAQWQLARTMLPGLQRVGVLYPPAHEAEVLALRKEAGEARVVARRLSGMPTARDVAELAQRVDVLLGISDTRFFSRETAKVILLSAYRHQRPWIGPTPAFVAAGAVASRAVPKADLIAAVVEQFRYWQRTGTFLPARTLTPGEVVCNVQVARSLAVDLSRVLCVPVRGGA